MYGAVVDVMKYELDCAETQYQKGSNDTVLSNKLGITDSREMDDVEADLLGKLYSKLFQEDCLELESITFDDVTQWHRQWLGNVYDWAGKIRVVNMSKGGFQFAASQQIESCIDTFECEYLSRFPEVLDMKHEELVSFLARVHVEFILIHPFREGNGRVGRLLMDMICYEYNSTLLDFSLLDQHKDYYIKSIQAGVSGKYEYMERLVGDIIK